MNNNLKTLNDLVKEHCGFYHADNILEEPLRALAKQHIHSFQLHKDKTTNIADKIIADRKIELLKYLFNLEG